MTNLTTRTPVPNKKMSVMTMIAPLHEIQRPHLPLVANVLVATTLTINTPTSFYTQTRRLCLQLSCIQRVDVLALSACAKIVVVCGLETLTAWLQASVSSVSFTRIVLFHLQCCLIPSFSLNSRNGHSFAPDDFSVSVSELCFRASGSSKLVVAA